MDSIENDLLVWNNLWRRSLEDEERKRVWSDYLSKCVGEDKGERLTFMMQLRMQERLVFPPGFPPNLNVKGKLEYLLWQMADEADYSYNVEMRSPLGDLYDDYQNQLYELKQTLETEGWTPSSIR